MKKILTRTFCVLLAVVFFVTVANGQDASAILGTAKTTINGLVVVIFNIVSIVMGLIGAVMLVVSLAKYLKGDPSSNDALMKVGGGLLIAVIILQVIKNTMFNV